MIDSQDVINILGGSPLGQDQNSGPEPTIRLDNTGTKQQKEVGYSLNKLIKSGSMTEIYSVQYPFRHGFSSKGNKKTRSKSTRSEEHRLRSIIRAINNVRRLTHLNFTENDKFLTLTFNNEQNFDINNLKECLPFYQKFIRQLHQIYPDLIYITVPEFQKRGAVHYHILCNIPFIQKDELNKLWPYGFSKPRAIKSSTHLAFYLCKYLGKRFDDVRKQGHRLFYSSRNLKRPQTYYGPIIDQISKKLEETHSDAVQYEREYDSKINGKVKYRQYVKKK